MIINAKNPTDLSGFYVVYEGSAQSETKGYYGISHLMEHLVHNRLKKYEDEFDENGITTNAYTSNTEIVFYITGLDEYVNKYRDIFLENILNFELTEKELEKEKNIVIEEYKDSFNGQAENHALNLLRKKFNYYAPIGLLEDLENITINDCLEFFEKQYKYPHKIINISKYNEYNKILKYSKNISDNKILHGEYDVQLEVGNEYKNKTSIINYMPIEDDFNYIKFISNMLASGLNSPLYKEIREKNGLVYYISMRLERITNNDGILLFSTETSDSNVNVIQDEFLNVINNPEKYMTLERFNLMKKSYEISFKKSDINLYSNINKFITPDNWNVRNILENVTYDKIMDIYNKYFINNNFYLTTDKK